jgi:anti-anti-sigma factor
MDYGLNTAGEETVVDLRGRLTFNDHAEFRELITEMVGSKKAHQVIDLSSLEFVDSAGLGMLLIAREELSGAKAELRLRNPQGQVKRVLNVARLSQIIKIEE